jgi:hypothetical protein
VSQSTGSAQPGATTAKVKKPPTPEQLERPKAALRFTLFVVVGAVLTVLLYYPSERLCPERAA